MVIVFILSDDLGARFLPPVAPSSSVHGFQIMVLVFHKPVVGRKSMDNPTCEVSKGKAGNGTSDFCSCSVGWNSMTQLDSAASDRRKCSLIHEEEEMGLVKATLSLSLAPALFWVSGSALEQHRHSLPTAS